MLSVDVVKALASEKRLQILHWLKQPRAHFPPQVDGDLVQDGVCGLFIAGLILASVRFPAHAVPGRVPQAVLHNLGGRS